MDFKGPTLIAVALGLVFSYSVFEHLEDDDVRHAPTRIQTVGGEISACNASGFDTVIGRMGCGGESPGGKSSRAGSAAFIRVD